MRDVKKVIDPVIREDIDQRLSEQYGAVPDPNSPAFDEYLNKLNQDGLRSDALKLTGAIQDIADPKDHIRDSADAAAERQKRREFLTKKLTRQDASGRYLSKNSAIILGALVLGPLLGVLLFSSGKPKKQAVKPPTTQEATKKSVADSTAKTDAGEAKAQPSTKDTSSVSTPAADTQAGGAVSGLHLDDGSGAASSSMYPQPVGTTDPTATAPVVVPPNVSSVPQSSSVPTAVVPDSASSPSSSSVPEPTTLPSQSQSGEVADNRSVPSVIPPSVVPDASSSSAEGSGNGSVTSADGSGVRIIPPSASTPTVIPPVVTSRPSTPERSTVEAPVVTSAAPQAQSKAPSKAVVFSRTPATDGATGAASATSQAGSSGATPSGGTRVFTRPDVQQSSSRVFASGSSNRAGTVVGDTAMRSSGSAGGAGVDTSSGQTQGGATQGRAILFSRDGRVTSQGQAQGGDQSQSSAQVQGDAAGNTAVNTVATPTAAPHGRSVVFSRSDAAMQRAALQSAAPASNTGNSSTSAALAPNAATNPAATGFGRYQPGQTVAGVLVGDTIAVYGAQTYVMVRAQDGSLWAGLATVDAAKRVQINFTMAADPLTGQAVAIGGMAFSATGRNGLDGTVTAKAPSLLMDLVRSALNGFDRYVTDLNANKTLTTTTSGTTVATGTTASLRDTLLAQASTVFRLPETGTTFVPVVELPKGTRLFVVVGAAADHPQTVPSTTSSAVDNS